MDITKSRKRTHSTDVSNLNVPERLCREFFDVNCIELAPALLGKTLVRQLTDGKVLKGRIVETECYLGGEDKASHSYNGRRTERNEPMYMVPGTSYIYMTYGMYYCFNISSREPGAAVLLRALAPVDGAEHMSDLRKTAKRKKRLKVHELCNGPAKLCIGLCLTKANSKLDLCESDEMWIEENSSATDDDFTTVIASRIGIESAGEEWAKKPLRFYIYGDKNVSKRDKIAEGKLNITS